MTEGCKKGITEGIKEDRVRKGSAVMTKGI